MPLNFRILRLQLLENYIFENIDVKFCDQSDKVREPYTTVIIGPNGTGKSNLLRIIIFLFAELNEFRTLGKRNAKIQGKFSFEYSLNGNHYQYHNYDFNNRKELKPQVLCNTEQVAFKNIELPSVVIALSVMLTDKFPAAITDYQDYVYLGVKVNSNTARTTSFINKTIDLLYETLDDQEVARNMSNALNFLGYEKKLFVSYYPRYKNIFFQGDLDKDRFESFFTKFWEHTKREKQNPPWSLGVFKRLVEDSSSIVSKLTRLCNKLSDHLEYEYEGGRTQYFEFDVFNNYLSSEELRLLKVLHSLDIVSYPSIGFNKNNSYFQLHESSSGEYHFISSFIGLLAKIKENSLVIIDEPENSLHPNWQMQYISFLKRAFRNHRSSHMIITTHSHLMVSDLSKSSSSIVGLNKDKIISASQIPSNTYGWTAEEILMKIFKTPSSRNYYLTEELNKIFELIAQEPNKRNYNSIKERIENLRRLNLSGLSEEDPLKDVVNRLFKKFANV